MIYCSWRFLLTFVSIKTLGAREKSTRYLRERRKENFGEAVVISIIIYRVSDYYHSNIKQIDLRVSNSLTQACVKVLKNTRLNLLILIKICDMWSGMHEKCVLHQWKFFFNIYKLNQAIKLSLAFYLFFFNI